jgi:hypothetical protein
LPDRLPVTSIHFPVPGFSCRRSKNLANCTLTWDPELLSSLSPVRAGLGIDAFISEAQALYGTAVDQVFLDDLGGIFWLDVAIPDGFRVDDDSGAMLALIETAGLIDANRAAESGGLGELLQLSVQFALAVCGARGTRGSFGAGVVTNENVVLENWQTRPPASRLQGGRA